MRPIWGSTPSGMYISFFQIIKPPPSERGGCASHVVSHFVFPRNQLVLRRDTPPSSWHPCCGRPSISPHHPSSKSRTQPPNRPIASDRHQERNGSVKPPINRKPPRPQPPRRQLQKRLLRHVDIVVRAPHALVAHHRPHRLAAVRDGDALVAVRVAVGLRPHQQVRQRHDVVAAVLAAVVEPARAEAYGVVRQLARVRGRRRGADDVGVGFGGDGRRGRRRGRSWGRSWGGDGAGEVLAG